MQTEFDSSALFPQHKVCEPKVEVPTVRIERWEHDDDRPARDVMVVQWYGDNDRQDLTKRICSLLSLSCVLQMLHSGLVIRNGIGQS